MISPGRIQTLTTIGALFAILLAFPLLSISDKPIQINGIPLLYLYLFIVWSVVILVAFLIVRKTSGKE